MAPESFKIPVWVFTREERACHVHRPDHQGWRRHVAGVSAI